MTDTGEKSEQRLDKWLWYSRLLKSRTSAAELVTDGRVRVNRVRVTKSSHAVRSGDVLTVGLRGRVIVLKVLAPGRRRGPPAEARQLYEIVADKSSDLSIAPQQPEAAPVAQRSRGTGRPSKRDRRLIDRLTEAD